MRKWLLLALMLCGTAATHAGAECIIRVERDDRGRDVLHIGNGLIEARVIPESSGRVLGLRLAEQSTELTPALVEDIVDEPLLPRMVSNNHAGYKDWGWGQNNPAEVAYDYRIVEAGGDRIVIELVAEFPRFAITRLVTLESDSLVVQQRISYENVTTNSQTVDHWAHLVLDGRPFINPETGESIIHVPAGMGHEARRGRRMVSFERPGVHSWKMGLGQHFFEPNEPWAARFSPTQRVGVAIRTSEGLVQPNGMLYTWQGESLSGPIVTLEIVGGTKELEPGATISFDVDILLFRDIESIDHLDSSHAVEKLDDQRWRVIALRSSDEARLHFEHDDKHGLTVPALNAGQSVVID